MRYIILLVLLVFLIVFTVQNYKKKTVVENFSQNYIKDVMKYMDNIKLSNKNKLAKIKSAETKKDKKYKTLVQMKREKILITGATNGLGYYVAKNVNMYSPKLFITGKDPKRVSELVEELKQTNDTVYGYAVDFTKKKSVQKLFDEAIKQMKNVTVLINCTNIKKGSHFFMSKREDDFLTEMNVNVNSTILLSTKVGFKMFKYKTRGRIINFSSYKSKNTKLNSNNGDKILTENIIEKFSSVYSQEMHKYGIGVTTIRMDEEFNFASNKNNKNNMRKIIGKTINNVLSKSPKKIKPVLEFALRAPMHEITGKILSTDNFQYNKELMNIVSPSKLATNNKVFDTATVTKTISRDKQDITTTLTKQNPFAYSTKVKKFLKSDNVFNKFNTMGKYDSILDNVLSKKYNVNKKQIVFFRTEYDALKKLVEMFVSKDSEILTSMPTFPLLDLVSIENKNAVTVVTLNNIKGKQLEVNYDNLNYSTKTKMVYLSSPNNISGQCIRENDRWNLFLSNLPDNVILVIDQRYMEFVDDIKELDSKMGPILDPLKVLKKHKNTIILRSFNNFYSVENLELCYLITNKSIAELIKNTQFVNPIDKFVENLALTVIDDKYYNNTKDKINKERELYFKKLDKHNIPYYTSDANFFLVETSSKKPVIMSDLENSNIILYSSHDEYNNYWTLPISTPYINKKVLEVIMYDNMENN
tara:strand:- start:2544 stop:4643 length:2100 start_codon:yes stop_codon:yes gene_type:complete